MNPVGDGRAALETPEPSAATTARRSSPSTWRRAIFLAWSALGAWLLYRVLVANAATLQDLLARGPGWLFVAAATACYVGCQLLAMGRWTMLARAAGVPLTLRQGFALGVAGEAGNLVMPGANGGDAVKVGLVVGSNLPIARGVASVVADRVSGLLGLLLVGFLAGAAQWSIAGSTVRRLTICMAVLAGGAAVAVALLLHPFSHRVVATIVRPWSRAAAVVAQFSAVAETYRSRWWGLVLAVAISMVSQSLALLVMYYSSAALSRDAAASLGSTLLAGPLVLASTAIPLPFGALGVTEEVGEKLFGVLGVPGGGLMMLGYRSAAVLAVQTLLVLLWASRVVWPESRHPNT